MMAARGLGANQAALLKYANSGDTPFGDRDQVVGYGAVAFWQGSPLPSTPAAPSSGNPMAVIPLRAGEKARLLAVARETIARYLQAGFSPALEVREPALQQKAAVFVTLKKGKELRGCIG